jgi:hypothetical protein
MQDMANNITKEMADSFNSFERGWDRPVYLHIDICRKKEGE